MDYGERRPSPQSIRGSGKRFMHINWKAHPACDLNLIVKGERLLKVTGSHVHWKSDNISETVLNRDVVTS